MWMGTRDWDKFAKGAAEFTPGATGVMEYYGFSDLSDYIEDRDHLETLINSYK